MKKKYWIIGALIIIIIVLSSLLVYYFNNKGTEDSLRFKEEYEKLNGESNLNGKNYRSIKIAKNNPFVYATPEDIINKINDKETFIVYFGFKSCPWCRSVLPTLIDVAKDLKIKQIYYVDVLDIRDTLEVDKKGKVKTTKEGSQGYYDLLKAFDNVLADYSLTDDKGNNVEAKEKRIYAPNIISVVDGTPKKLTTGISSKQTDGYMELTKEMTDDTYNLIKEVLETIK